MALLLEGLPGASTRATHSVAVQARLLNPHSPAGRCCKPATTAENLVDSWLAPLLANSFFCLGGAYAYGAVSRVDRVAARRFQNGAGGTRRRRYADRVGDLLKSDLHE